MNFSLFEEDDTVVNKFIILRKNSNKNLKSRRDLISLVKGVVRV